MDDIAYLISITSSEDDNGFPNNTETRAEIFVDKKSVTRSEFYSSLQVGIKATAVFETSLADYEEAESPTIIENEGKRYDIIRTYTLGGDRIELTCSDQGAPK